MRRSSNVDFVARGMAEAFTSEKMQFSLPIFPREVLLAASLMTNQPRLAITIDMALDRDGNFVKLI